MHFYQDSAKYASDDDLQSLWGSVLAQEIRQTGSVSKRTMAVLKTLDKSTALAFQKMRSQAIGFRGRGTLSYAVPATHDEQDKDDRFAVDFHTRELMSADGLVLSSFAGHTATVSAWQPVVRYQGTTWCLKPLGSREPKQGDTVEISCYAMGLTGNEIAKVIRFTRDEEHERKLIDYLGSKNVALVPMPADCPVGQSIPEKYHRYVIEY